MTKYPNLLAEYEARGWHIQTWAGWANVTEEVMRDVLYNGAELTPEEIKGMRAGGNENYLSSPELTLIDTNNKIKRLDLDKFMKWFDGVADVFTDSFYKAEYRIASTLANAYRADKPISVAIYGAGMSAKSSLEYALKPKSAPRGSKSDRSLIKLPKRNDKNMSNIQILEYKSERILTTQQLAGAYGTDTNNIQKNFSNNKDRFIEGRDYYFLQGEELKAFKDYLNDIQVVPKNAPSLYLWTMRGANRHCKILDTDQAWKQFDILEETYFKVKSGNYIAGVDQSKLSPQMQTLTLMVQQMAQMEMQAQEAKQIALEARDEIKELTAKIKTIPDEYYSIAGYASLRGFKVDISKAGLLGRKASKLSKEYDIDVGKAYDPRFGQVNTYHLDVLKEVFAVLEQEIA